MCGEMKRNSKGVVLLVFVQVLKDDDSKVLFHSVLGKNRSVALLVAYLVDQLGLDLLRAMKKVMDKRPRVLDNIYFVKQLVKFSAIRGRCALYDETTLGCCDKVKSCFR